MAKYLVIVESPAKAKTIHKFLGKNYTVVASNGHVRDLPKSQMGIDVENDFEPKYITIRGKGDILAMLRKEVKKADKVYLATDPDREGEAISWHLAYALKLEGKNVHRITFNEITKTAVKNSIKNAREIDMNLVDAQQARRVLDRLVGYSISPVLWAKVKRGLSAGRVQSVALHIINDREKEIDAFIPEEYWSLDANLNVEDDKKPLKAKFHSLEGKKIEIHSREDVEALMARAKDAPFVISDIKHGERSKKSPLPFTTSTLQQEASKQLNFSTQKTMRIAPVSYTHLCLSVAYGDSCIYEHIFENRFRIVPELKKMGADIRLQQQCAQVHGVKALHAGRVTAMDLRGGAGLVLAALAAEGKTCIDGAEFIRRGYENICARCV